MTIETTRGPGPGAVLTLRPVSADDLPFLCAVYASTREQELTAVAWDAAQKAAFLDMQFRAQHTYYLAHYPDAAFDVILINHQPAGRLYIDRATSEIRIVDIALLPEWCNRGIGSALINVLQGEAAAAGKPLRIHVERFNPALKLYERLGFHSIADRGVYLFMEWSAPLPSA